MSQENYQKLIAQAEKKVELQRKLYQKKKAKFETSLLLNQSQLFGESNQLFNVTADQELARDILDQHKQMILRAEKELNKLIELKYKETNLNLFDDDKNNNQSN